LAVSDEPEHIGRDFKQLQVRQKAHRSVLDVYSDTQSSPPEERFGLTARPYRAGASSRPGSPSAPVGTQNGSLPAA
jgi:hypothetical protein